MVGHLTHGKNLEFLGKEYNFHGYSVSPDTETINYDEVEKLALNLNQNASCWSKCLR